MAHGHRGDYLFHCPNGENWLCFDRLAVRDNDLSPENLTRLMPRAEVQKLFHT